MGIKLLGSGVDAAGFPVVTWKESRDLFGSTKVTCSIERNAVSNALLFVTNGSLLKGPLYSRRPWQALRSFKWAQAGSLYDSPLDTMVKQAWAGKSRLGQVLLEDSRMVMLAEFGDEHASVPMHLNCAEGAMQVELVELHNELQRQFINQRTDVIERVCGGEFQ